MKGSVVANTDLEGLFILQRAIALLF